MFIINNKDEKETKMRKIVLILAVVFFAFAGESSAQEPGHYQLFQGKYKHWNQNNGSSEQHDDLFMLDTTTGDAKIFISTEKDGKRLRYWETAAIDDNKATFGNVS